MPANAKIKSLSNLFAFGDSLSDSGNSKSVSQSAIGFTFPPAPYFDGRFSNGPWRWNISGRSLIREIPISKTP